MAIKVESLVEGELGIARETFFVLLEVAHDAVGLGPVEPARGAGGQLRGAADQQVAGGRVAAALGAPVAVLGLLSQGGGGPQP